MKEGTLVSFGWPGCQVHRARISSKPPRYINIRQQGSGPAKWIGMRGLRAGDSVDGSEIRRENHLGCSKNPLNNYGINYQPPLVIAGFLNHQQ